jgi:hypothetical protein
MAADRTIEQIASNIQSHLHVRFATASYPIPVIKSYDSSSDLYLTVQQDANVNAIIKFERETAASAGALDMFGNAQRVYCPHVIKCLFETGAHATGTFTVSAPTAGVRASGTATLASTIANDILTIRGVAFTAKAATPGANEFLVGIDDTATAANLAAAINASVSAEIAGIITASSLTNVVTVRAVAYGTAGNAYTFTETSDTITVSGAGTLAGGVASATVVVNGVTFSCVGTGDGSANQFVKGLSDTATAAALAAAINASTTARVVGVVTATSTDAVTTLTAVIAGLGGNAIILTGSTGLTAATMSGGTSVGCPDWVKCAIIAECARVGTKLNIYEDAGLAVADCADSTKLVVSISDIPWGIMAHV